MRRLINVVCSIGFLLYLCKPSPADALPSAGDYIFSGVVTEVPDALSSEFAVGELVTGTMSLSLSQKVPVGSYELAYYNFSNFHANFGGDYPLESPAGVFTIINFDAGSDYVKVEVSSPLGMTGPEVAGHSVEYFSSNLFYEDGTLTSTDLISRFITPGFLFDVSGFRFDVDDSLSVRFRFDDISIVPEPNARNLAAAAFLSSCFASSLIAPRRAKRQLAN